MASSALAESATRLVANGKKRTTVLFGVRNPNDTKHQGLHDGGFQIGSVADAAQFGEVVVLATPRRATQSAIETAGVDLLMMFSEVAGDDVVTEAEYNENRIITDEAKTIFQKMDDNRDNQLTKGEFMKNASFKDRKLAAAVFNALNMNGDKALTIPEYLRVWGNWARVPQANKKNRPN